MELIFEENIWSKKGATLSDVSAKKEYGLSQETIYQAIREGKLQYRENNFQGNPWLRLLRHEVEKLVGDIYGANYLYKKVIEKELKQINKELKQLKLQIDTLEQRKCELLKLLKPIK